MLSAAMALLLGSCWLLIEVFLWLVALLEVVIAVWVVWVVWV